MTKGLERLMRKMMVHHGELSVGSHAGKERSFVTFCPFIILNTSCSRVRSPVLLVVPLASPLLFSSICLAIAGKIKRGQRRPDRRESTSTHILCGLAYLLTL